MNEPWRISLLGGLRVEGNQTTITRFNSQKTTALLAYLAYFLKNMHAREILTDIFWQEATPEAGRASLSTALSTLRNQLEPLGVPTGGVIRADRYSVGLNPAAVTTDVAEFDAALISSKSTSKTTERANLLMKALDLYQGCLLPGLYDEWITAEQQRLSGHFFDATHQLLTYLTEIGDITTALHYARKAVSVDPIHEEANRSLMSLLVTAGQPGSALWQYKEFERRLEEESGDEPSAQLRALARQIEKESGLGHLIVVAPVHSSSPLISPVNQMHATMGQMSVSHTVTFLMTDVEGSARHEEQNRDAFKQALERHLELLRSEFTRSGGQVIQEGASCLVAFGSARKALQCAVACQTVLMSELWPDAIGMLEVHIALDTGEVEVRGNAYHGHALQQVNRMLMAAHGRQILISESTAAMVRNNLSADGIHLIDLGVYQLRDTPGLHRLFQVDYPDMGNSVFPPLGAIAGHPSQLPLRFTRFFGREREIAELSEMLRSPNIPLVTVTGTGGTGKTRFVLEVAERLIEPFEGAVYFVPLAEVAEASLVWDVILTVLHVPRNSNRELVEQVLEVLNRQRSLIILDNMEQLVTTGGAEVVQTLVSRVPTLKVLITSRQLLSLSAEHEFALAPLPIPKGDESLERLSVFESVLLFLDRAQIVKPDFRVTNYNVAAVAELVNRLEGIPLAIELAAARAQALTPLQMLDQLERRFSFLVSRKRDVSERHRTLYAALDWSYRLLSPELQRFFCRLSVFRGGWSVEAAETVCEEPLALDYLAQLRECSLILTDESGQAIRFRMLESLREYALERLKEAAEELAVRKRHLGYFLQLAQEASPHLLSGPQQAVWLERLGQDHENLYLALQQANAHPETAEAGILLYMAVWHYLTLQRTRWEGMHWTETILPSLARVSNTLRAAGLNQAGAWAKYCSDRELALSWLQESVNLYRQLEDKHGLSWALHNLASCTEDSSRALSLLEESLLLARELGDKNLILWALGVLSSRVEDPLQQWRICEERLKLAREANNSWEVATILNVLGSLSYDSGNLQEGLRHHQEALQVASMMNALRPLAQSLVGMARYAIAMDHVQNGVRLLSVAITIWHRLGLDEDVLDISKERRKALDLLGTEAFAAIWEEGKTMAIEKAIAYTLQEE